MVFFFRLFDERKSQKSIERFKALELVRWSEKTNNDGGIVGFVISRGDNFFSPPNHFFSDNI